MTSFKFASLLLATALPITAVCAEERLGGTESSVRGRPTTDLNIEPIGHALSDLSCNSANAQVTTVNKVTRDGQDGGGSVKLLVVRVNTPNSAKLYKVKEAFREGGRILVKFVEVTNRTGQPELGINSTRYLLTGGTEFSGDHPSVFMDRKVYRDMFGGTVKNAFQNPVGIADAGLKCQFTIGG